VLDDLIRLINPTGHLGVIGVYMANDPGAIDEHAKKGEYMLPFGHLWEKGMSVGTGQTPVKAIHEMLRDMIIGGQAKPSFIVSHRTFDEVPEALQGV
jgi:glutathione-independent formaldehyde dehydrogenase